MNTAIQPQERCSVEDYLEGEQRTDIKHEYLAGQVVAMGGASDRYGLIAMSPVAWLLPNTRRKGCQLFSADMKVRIDHEGDRWFYYPMWRSSGTPPTANRPTTPATPVCWSNGGLPAPSTSTAVKNSWPIACSLACASTQADLYQRGDDDRWQHWRFTNPDDAIHLACLDVPPTLRGIYADLPELFA